VKLIYPQHQAGKKILVTISLKTTGNSDIIPSFIHNVGTHFN